MGIKKVASVGLIRRSKEDQSKGICTIQTQRSKIEEALDRPFLGAKGKIAKEHWFIDGKNTKDYWFVEDDVSGKLIEEDRPALQKIRELAEAGIIKRIYVWDYDRFSRNTWFALKFLDEMLSLDVMLISSYAPMDYRDKSMWQSLTLKFSSGQLEREMISQRTTDVLKEKASNGHWCGGNHYGYDTAGKGKLTINKAEATIIRRIFAEYLEGNSTRTIIEGLRDEEVPSPGAKKKRAGAWNPATITRILGNPLYAGYIYYTEIFAKGRHPPLVEVETWNKAQVQREKKNFNKDKAKPTIVRTRQKNRVNTTITKVRLFTIVDEKIQPMNQETTP